jgi:predicted dehydrogenase
MRAVGDVARIGLLGLGTIARTHLRVLDQLPGAAVVFGVDPADPAPATRAGLAVHRTLQEPLAHHGQPDLIVIATPTPTHVELLGAVLRLTEGLVLVEKPLSASTAALDRLEGCHGTEELARRVRVAHHFAFSPEVLAAERLVREHGRDAAPRWILCSFNDPYVHKPEAERASLVSSWVDSGPNQLSLLSRFATGFQVVEREESPDGFTSRCRLRYDGGSALLVANWWAADSSKQTSLHFDDGTEVRMDHTSMTAMAVRGGRLLDHVRDDGSRERKVAHYEELYRALLDGTAGREAGYSLGRELASVLEDRA